MSVCSTKNPSMWGPSMAAVQILNQINAKRYNYKEKEKNAGRGVGGWLKKESYPSPHPHLLPFLGQTLILFVLPNSCNAKNLIPPPPPQNMVKKRK